MAGSTEVDWECRMFQELVQVHIENNKAKVYIILW